MPADLHRKEDDAPFLINLKVRFEAWVTPYAPFFLIISIIILIVFIIALAMALTGVRAYQLTGTEANAMYNHLGEIV